MIVGADQEMADAVRVALFGFSHLQRAFPPEEMTSERPRNENGGCGGRVEVEGCIGDIARLACRVILRLHAWSEDAPHAPLGCMSYVRRYTCQENPCFNVV